MVCLRFSRDATDGVTTSEGWVGVRLKAKTAIILE
jgi:hypothetical protein